MIAGRFSALGSTVGLDRCDLVSVGNIGLLLAIRRHEPEKGFAFSTFAFSYVKGYILSEINRVRWGRHDDYSQSGPVMHQSNGERELEEDRLSPLDVLIQKEDVARVHDAMDGAGQGGEIVRLRFIEGVKPQELQKKYGRRGFCGTKKIHKGIGAMQKILDPESGEHRPISLSGLYSKVQ